jgi:hypothetical protein
MAAYLHLGSYRFCLGGHSVTKQLAFQIIVAFLAVFIAVAHVSPAQAASNRAYDNTTCTGGSGFISVTSNTMLNCILGNGNVSSAPTISIYSIAANKFASVDYTRQAYPVIAQATAVNAWERFSVNILSYPFLMTIQSTATSKCGSSCYVSANSDVNSLITNVSSVNTWEEYQLYYSTTLNIFAFCTENPNYVTIPYVSTRIDTDFHLRPAANAVNTYEEYIFASA